MRTRSGSPTFVHDDLAGYGATGQPHRGDSEKALDIKWWARRYQNARPLPAPNVAQQSAESVFRLADVNPFHPAIVVMCGLPVKLSNTPWRVVSTHLGDQHGPRTLPLPPWLATLQQSRRRAVVWRRANLT